MVHPLDFMFKQVDFRSGFDMTKMYKFVKENTVFILLHNSKIYEYLLVELIINVAKCDHVSIQVLHCTHVYENKLLISDICLLKY